MIIQCNNLTKNYDNNTVVNNLSFEVKRGEVFALLGANGAGKTTTIKMILGLTSPTNGICTLVENLRIGYSPESPYFPPFLSGRDVLEYYGKITRIPKKELNELIPKLLGEVGLEDNKIKVKNYSKGMMQRLSLAQSLLDKPELLILDEPTSGLDALGRIEMMNIINKLKKQGVTIILNSHILEDIERVCDRGIIMKKGKLVRSWKKESTDTEKSLEEYFVESLQMEENNNE